MCSPPLAGANTRSSPPALFRAFLHCYYKNVYGIRPVTRELQNTVVWLSCGFRSTASRDAVDRRDLEHVVDEVRPPRRAGRLPRPARLDLPIDSTDVRTMPAYQDASKGYDPTAEEYYHGYGCTIVSTGQKIPIAAGVHREQASARGWRCASRDALAVEKPIWMLGDSAYDTLAGTTTCWPQGRASRPYNARNTDDPKDIEYRVEARIDEHSEDVQLKQSTLDETYNRRREVERTNDAVKDCGLGHVRARGRVHARAQVFLALCLRLVIAITNDERGDNPRSTVITL